MRNVTRVLTWLYAILLRLYPRRFRAEFGDEMQSVFSEALCDRSGRRSVLLFLREVHDLPSSLLEAYAADWSRGGNISMSEEPISPSTRWQAFLGMLPFLAFGVSSMIGKVDPIHGLRGHNAEMVVYALALAGLLIGWIRGFPLWSYSYLGWSLVLAWANTNMRIGGTDWGYRLWLPLGGVVLIALLWTRSLQPIKKFFRDIWTDWTHLSLAMYALIAWVSMIYDENHHPYLLAFMLASTLVSAGVAWFFLRSSSTRGRILDIVGGLVIAMIIDSICWGTWDWHEYNGIAKQPTTWYKQVWNHIMLLFFWGIILLWPSIVGLIRRKTTRQTG